MLLNEKVRSAVRRQFGADLPNAKYLMNSEGKVFMFTGELPHLNYDKAGLYVGTMEQDGFRPSIEGAQLIRGRDMIELNLKETLVWMCGISLRKSVGAERYVILRHGRDILGSGKAKQDRILNYLPKNRRLPLKMMR